MPLTVNTPLSVKLPVVAVTSNAPFTVDVPKSKAMLFTTVALPVVPAVISDTAPVAANVPKLISSSACTVLIIDVPPTVTVPLSVTFPVVALAVKLPPTPEAAKSNAVAFTTLALAVAPVVLNVTAPVDANVPKSISSFVFEVVKLEVVVTVSVPLSVKLPVVAVAPNVPVTVPAKLNAVSFVINVLPADVKTTSASACNVSSVMPAFPISLSVTLPTTLKLPLSVIVPFVVFTSNVPDIVLAAISIVSEVDKTTLLPLTIETAPPKSFVAVFKVMLSPI